MYTVQPGKRNESRLTGWQVSIIYIEAPCMILYITMRQAVLFVSCDVYI